MTSNPFIASSSSPGKGVIELSLLPPNTPTLAKLSYQYPLKLIAPDPIALSNGGADAWLVHTVYLLTYGGGVVAGDTMDLRIDVASHTRLILLTQGSTKIFRAPNDTTLSKQLTTVNVQASSALCYLPDPVQPFAESAFEQVQVYRLLHENASICVCDWVCGGRTALGENWDFRRYSSVNEIWWIKPGGERAMLLRDNMILDSPEWAARVVDRVDGLGTFGTLIMRGQVFGTIGNYFLTEFTSTPRIGEKRWDDAEEVTTTEDDSQRRRDRQEFERRNGILWTAARVRGFVLVKFSAHEVRGAKLWLRTMFQAEGSVERNFGERALYCLK